MDKMEAIELVLENRVKEMGATKKLIDVTHEYLEEHSEIYRNLEIECRDEAAMDTASLVARLHRRTNLLPKELFRQAALQAMLI